MLGEIRDDTQLAFWSMWRTIADVSFGPSPSHDAGPDSAGNGSLMRVAPVLLPHIKQPSPALWRDTVNMGLITHNSPAAISSCVAFIDLLWNAIGLAAPPSDDWWRTEFVDVARQVEGDETRYASRTPHIQYSGPMWRYVDQVLESAATRDLDTLTACDEWHSGAYLMETVPSALYILMRHAADPEEAIIRAVNDTWDNDTTAAIVGAAVGALHGRSALPERWIDRLLGRTTDSDDGAVFKVIDMALERWTDGNPPAH